MADDPIKALIREFSRLPGVGEKSATRLTFHLLKQGPEPSRRLAQALIDLADKTGLCSTCGMPTQTDPCAYCADPRRDDGIICVVEKPQDLLAIDRTGEYRGRFHILHGTLSPLEGRGPDEINVKGLLARLAAAPSEPGAVREIILALSPTVEGDATALYITRLVKPLGVSVSRIAQGVPMGSDLEFADRVTLARALEARRTIE